MAQTHIVNINEENEFQKILEQIKKYYYLYLGGIIIALGIAFFFNQYSVPVYKITSSLIIRDNQNQQNLGDYLTSNLFGANENLQNELLLLKSSPVISQTIKNLDLPVTYFEKRGFQYFELYKNVPFKIMYQHNHDQPLGVRFEIKFHRDSSFSLVAKGEDVPLYNFEEEIIKDVREEWSYRTNGRVGQLIESPDLSFIIALDSSNLHLSYIDKTFYFSFSDVPSLTDALKAQMEFNLVDIDATAIEVNLKSSSVEKGLDILNGIMDVYSNKNLEKKNHFAKITIDYIDKQIGEIADSLNRTEQTLQRFRSSNQLLNVTEQASGIATQYRDLENKLAELVTQKRYYDYVSDYLNKNEDYANIIVPASLGIQDQLLNNLIGELIAAQSKKSNLIENNQEKNPLVKKLSIQIENLKKTISENISYVLKTTEISIDELNKRIGKIQAQISRMPNTERQLAGIERNFRFTDAIYNYLMQKRAEANITQASNIPNNEIIEPARLNDPDPISPNKIMNYIIGLLLGIICPFTYLQLKSSFNNKIETQDQIEKITNIPVLGKIPHNRKKTNNVVFEHSNSTISEAYRALRTNLEYYVRGGHKKIIMVTSSIENEGKSFNALNIAMSYAQFNRKTILIDFDLRKNTNYFNNSENLLGLSSYLINKANLEDIIIKSPHIKLDYISSGPIPPNPVELIGLDKTEKLFNLLKEQYDYIIIDTPPLAQVTDAYLLIEQADVKVLIARYNYTLKRIFSFVIKDLKQKDIKNVCIILNDNRIFKEQYGYGYGYAKKDNSTT